MEEKKFDLEQLKKHQSEKQYEKRLNYLENKDNPLNTQSIKKTVEGALKKISLPVRSFVIYGEPQSGKTEMMIALTLKLLDEGFKTIIILINDNVPLLDQNLNRFKQAGINPSPKNFKEILDENIKIENIPSVIFCKKNSRDLQKLIEKLGNLGGRVILDDEADFATPNSKINSLGEKSKINKLTEELRGDNGIWIGVTATPARIDLNNTHGNENTHWVEFEPHINYTGQDQFFPVNQEEILENYNLILLEDDDPNHIIKAVLNFLIKVGYLNTLENNPRRNYSMIIHTSGKVDDHKRDYQIVIKLINTLSHKEDPEWEHYYNLILNTSSILFPGKESEIARYIVDNINRTDIFVMNSKKELAKINSGTPLNPFSIYIGGNIISRGVTFDNLISMFFTRNVKGTFHQDTFIQRARMFGSRKDYLKHFELTIPEELYNNWHQSFILHRLSLQSIRAGNEPPVWLFDNKIKPTALSSIDRSTVIMHDGEMSFGVFDKPFGLLDLMNSKESPKKRLQEIYELLKDQKAAFPKFLLDYINKSAKKDEDIAILFPSEISKWIDADKEKLTRPRGFISSTEQNQKRFTGAKHYIKLIYIEETKKARIIYKPKTSRIGFMINEVKKREKSE